MSNSTDPIYKTLQEQSRWTDRVIRKGFSSGLGILEESITDFNLLEVSDRHSDYILTRKFNRREEGSSSGADWLWCIGQPGAWISLLIQAKIINPKTAKCHYLNYKTKRGEPQRVLLQRFASVHSLVPLYCVYSHLQDGFSPSAKAHPTLSSLENVEWACSFVTPKYIKKVIEETRAQQVDILRYGIPWMYPFLNDLNQGSGMAANIAHALEEMRKSFVSLNQESHGVPHHIGRRGRPKKERIDWSDPNPTNLVTSRVPSIVTRMLQGKSLSRKPPISAISIISSIPIEEIDRGYGLLSTGKDAPFFPVGIDLRKEQSRVKR